ncbi:MAG: PEP-CTERM/exosortase system-associated acyltransferase [Candidatus Competibacteraceae bacterium]
MNTIPLSTHFQNYFQLRLAYTQELIERVQRVRYDVYCREFGYEREENCPGGLEKDDYDQHSVHCLIVHKASDTPAGCVRLVKTPPHDPSLPLPLEKFCGHSLTHATLHPAHLPRTGISEISRLAVHTDFRRRPGESESPMGHVSGLEITEVERRTFPLISLALFAAATVLTLLTQRKDVFVMVEPRLAGRLQGAGLPFIQVGDLLDYHGDRAPYYIHTDSALENMKEELRALYDFVYENLKADVDQAGINLAQ